MWGCEPNPLSMDTKEMVNFRLTDSSGAAFCEIRVYP
jgi:hypothetical protein